MATALRSPRTFCLHCAARIDFAYLRQEHGITNSLYGFCSPACEVNYGCLLEQATNSRQLSPELRTFLSQLQASVDAWQVGKNIHVHATNWPLAVGLAKAGLVVLHGRNGVTITVKGDISFIRSRLLAGPRFSDPRIIEEDGYPEDLEDGFDPESDSESEALRRAEDRAGYWWGQEWFGNHDG